MLEIHEWINIWESDDKESNPINEVKNKINHYINSMEFYCDYHIGLDFYNANLSANFFRFFSSKYVQDKKCIEQETHLR